jgi:hypothetical protein
MPRSDLEIQNPLLSLLPSVRIEEFLQKEAKAAKGIVFQRRICGL